MMGRSGRGNARQAGGMDVLITARASRPPARVWVRCQRLNSAARRCCSPQLASPPLPAAPAECALKETPLGGWPLLIHMLY